MLPRRSLILGLESESKFFSVGVPQKQGLRIPSFSNFWSCQTLCCLLNLIWFDFEIRPRCKTRFAPFQLTLTNDYRVTFYRVASTRMTNCGGNNSLSWPAISSDDTGSRWWRMSVSHKRPKCANNPRCERVRTLNRWWRLTLQVGPTLQVGCRRTANKSSTTHRGVQTADWYALWSTAINGEESRVVEGNCDGSITAYILQTFRAALYCSQASTPIRNQVRWLPRTTTLSYPINLFWYEPTRSGHLVD